MRLYLKFINIVVSSGICRNRSCSGEFFQVIPAVNAVLAGNIRRSFALRWRIWLSFDCRGAAPISHLSAAFSRTEGFMKRVLVLCFVLLVAGCVSTHELTAFQPVSSKKALIRWQRKGRSLVYDAVCSISRPISIKLYKQTPMPLVEFRLGSANFFEVNGRLAGRGWAGPRRCAASFSTWIWFLTAYQRSAQPGSASLPSETMRVTSTKTADRLKVLSVSNSQTSEVVSAIFN